ncbi:MAG: hypothetical protein Q8M99_08095 [Methylotenera sp.]|nr:hypothetical protein [Methylotenera sp.]
MCIISIILSATACSQIPHINHSLWQSSIDESITINGIVAIIAESRLFIAKRSNKVCVIYNHYSGGTLFASTLYKGTISRGTALVYKKKELYISGENAWENVEPIQILMAGSKLVIRFERPTAPDDAALVSFHKIDSPVVNQKNETGFKVNEKAECESVI